MSALIFCAGSRDADSMLAAGGGYTGTTLQLKGDLSMMILCGPSGFSPLCRIQAWALERLVWFQCASGDVRWAMVALALRSFTAAWAFVQARFRGRWHRC